MKKYLIGIVMLCSLLFGGMSSAYAQAWHYVWSQQARNTAIVNAAVASWHANYNNTGLCNCYTWVSSVLSTASNGVMALPPQMPPPTEDQSVFRTNDGNPYGQWITQWHFTTVPGTTPAISTTALPGHAVQMLTRYANGTWGPHTAIMYYSDVANKTVYFLNANYTGCGVQMTSMTWDQFNSRVSKYTIGVIR